MNGFMPLRGMITYSEAPLTDSESECWSTFSMGLVPYHIMLK